MRSWYRQGMIMIGLLIVTSFPLAGCGSPTTSSGGTLTVFPSPYGAFTANFNPLLPNSSRSGTQGLIYETLLFFNQMHGGQITPWLASGYQFNSNATRLTFNLRTDVLWSDGQAFTSADVVYTLDLLKQYPALDTAGLWQAITTLGAPDPYTVVVTFHQPSAQILWSLAGQTFIVPEHLWKEVKDPTTEANPHPVGTGPFTLKSFSSQVYVLGKNHTFWQPGKPSIDQIDYPSYDSNAMQPPYPEHLDWSGIFSSDLEQTWTIQDPAHNHYWFPPESVIMLYLNLAKAPFNQVAVRLAISTAIDRQALSVQAELGYEPVASPTGLVLPANQHFLDPQYQDVTFGAANPVRAAEILSAAGFTKGSDGVFADASGHQLAFTLDVVNGWSDWDTASQIISTNLKAAGMNVSVNRLNFQDFVKALSNGAFEAAISWTNPGPTPYYLYSSLLGSGAPTPGGSTAATNWEGWEDATTDHLLAQYAGSPDLRVQQQAIVGLEQIMVEHIPSIPLFDEAIWYEYSTARFVGWPNENNPYASPAPWNYPDEEQVALHLHKV